MLASIQSLSTFLKEMTPVRKKELVICSLAILLIGFLTYGYSFFSFTYNNDGILRVSEIDISFESGLVKGRWMYAFFSNLYFSSFRLPLFHGILVVLLLLLCTLLLWYIFEIKGRAERILTGGIFMTLPLFIHYIYFTGDAEVYGSGMVLIFFSLLSFTRHTLSAYIVSVILIVLALGCYPALFSVATVLYMFYVIHAFTKNPQIRQNMVLFLKSMGICALGLLLYFLATKGMIAFLGLKLMSYKNADELSIPVLLTKLPHKLMWTFLLHGLYVLMASIWYKIFFVLGLFGMFRIMSGKTNFAFGRSLYAVFLICAMLIGALSIYLVTFETWPYPGFQFGIIILATLLVLYTVRLFGDRLKPIAYIMGALFILLNIRTDNAIALKYTLKLDAGQRLASHIMHDILSHEGYVKGKTKIAFVGALVNNSNYDLSDPFPKAKVHNDLQLAPVGFAGFGVETKIANQLTLQGVNVDFFKRSQLEEYKNYAVQNSIPDYPKSGSILQLGDVLILNLGLSTATIPKEEKFWHVYENSKFLKYLTAKMVAKE